MNSEFIALVSFVLITTFTPGPNNISSASMGILYGYKKTLRYLGGIATGFFLIMLLCGWISATLRQWLAGFEMVLRIVGALYILWLAYHTFKASYNFDEDEQPLIGFSNGFLLQLLNPKVIVYGLTLYATFVGGSVANPFYLLLSALAFAGVAFVATSTWTLFGAAIRTYMGRSQVKQQIKRISDTPAHKRGVKRQPVNNNLRIQ